MAKAQNAKAQAQVDPLKESVRVLPPPLGAAAQIEAPPVKVTHHEGRHVQSIYFPDRAIVNRIKASLERFPRSSMSNVVTQLMTQFCNQMEKSEDVDKKRQLNFEARVWL